MNWDAADFDWNQARAFLATAEEGSLSAAARALGVTQPTLSRQVSALEKGLGVTLFERGPRTMKLTAAGTELLSHVRVMHEAATQFSLSASGQNQDVSGMVRIACTHMMACCHLPDILSEIRQAAPDIEIEVNTSNELRDLLQREADIAIRHARPTQSELIAKLVRTTCATLYASKEYLDRIGRPNSVDSLQKADYLGFESIEMLIPIYQQAGIELTRRNFPVTTDSGPVSLELVRKGFGIGLLLPDDAELVPGLERVWDDFPAIEIPIWLVTHRELHTSKRIRLVFDILANHLSMTP